MRNLKSLLSPNDAEALNASNDISWVPKKPREVLLPYVPNSTDVEESEVDQQRKKAQMVLDEYEDIIGECKRLEAQIEERCKKVAAPLSKKNNLRVMESMARVFGQGQQESISFDQYKACIQALAILNNQLPKPEDKE